MSAANAVPAGARTLALAVAVGRIEWGYRRAAGVLGARLTRTAGRWAAAGTLEAPDGVALMQTPLTFVVGLQNGSRWTWPVVSQTITGAAWSAVLGGEGEVT